MNLVRSIVSSAAVALALTGCGSTSSPIGPAPVASPTAVPAAASIRLRIINGSPGTGNVDLYLYVHGTLRPGTPTFSNVPFGGITPYVRELNAQYDLDVLRAGAVPIETASIHVSNVTNFAVLNTDQTNSMTGSLVISGTNLGGTRMIQFFQEPFETSGRSALVIHHASPAANSITAQGPIGVGIYSAATYPPGTLPAALPARATKQLAALTFVQNPSAVPEPNSLASDGAMLFLTPFPTSALPPAVGFAVGLPSPSKVALAPIVSVIANATLSETANENQPYSGQNTLTNDVSETVPAGTHISEFLIDADQNGNLGFIGTIDP